MTQPTVTGLRSIEYGMPDIRQAAKFFEENWGLAPVATTDGAIYLRASGPEHHIAVVRQSPKTGHVRVNLAAPDKATVDALHAHAKGLGVDVLGAPAAIGEPGGGYGFGLFIVDDSRWGRIVAHSGGYPGFGANMRWQPASGLGVIVLANHRYAPATLLARELMTALIASEAVARSRASASDSTTLTSVTSFSRLTDSLFMIAPSLAGFSIAS